MTLNAILCEGSAEEAIIEILLENDALIIKKETLLSGKIFRERSIETFLNKYLRTQLDEKVTIYRILDSKKQGYNLSNKLRKEFNGKFKIVDVITSPEIEVLIILSEGKYKEFLKVKSSNSPSKFCKKILKLKQVKRYNFVKQYFSNIDTLIRAIKQYYSIKQKDNKILMLYDLLEPHYKK